LSRKSVTPEVTVIETEKAKLNKPLLIMGFAGAGLVGGIAVTHIIDQLEMKKIAHIRCEYLPPAAVFVDGILRHPMRIYAGSEGKLCSVVSEISLPSNSAFSVAQALLDWAEKKEISEVVILEGIPMKKRPEKIESFCVAEPEKIQECVEKGIKMLSAGFIGGIAGSILNECLTRKIVGLAFLTPTLAFLPDPEGAASLVQALNKVYDLKISTTELLKKGSEIKKKLKEIAERHKQMRAAEDKRGMPEKMYV
jgi:uncharacterized protein